jgi:hypothetical protein
MLYKFFKAVRIKVVRISVTLLVLIELSLLSGHQEKCVAG